MDSSFVAFTELIEWPHQLHGFSCIFLKEISGRLNKGSRSLNILTGNESCKGLLRIKVLYFEPCLTISNLPLVHVRF